MATITTTTKTDGVKYHVINRRNGQTMSICSTRRAASRKQDKHDNNYGGYAHTIRVYVNGIPTERVI